MALNSHSIFYFAKKQCRIFQNYVYINLLAVFLAIELWRSAQSRDDAVD